MSKLAYIVIAAAIAGGLAAPAEAQVEANAATRTGLLTAVAAPLAQSLFHLAQTATVLCQEIVDGRYIHRRVQTPEGCFDEVIDTYNGQVVKRDPAPCTPQC